MKELDEQHGDQCCPNLNKKRILAGSDKGFDLQILLEGFEKQLDLPTVFVNRRYGGGTKLKMVGQQSDFTALLFIAYNDLTQRVGTIFAGLMAIEADKLIGQDISIFRNRAILDDRIIGIFP